MMRWLALAEAKLTGPAFVPKVPLVPKAPSDRPIGTNGTNGTTSKKGEFASVEPPSQPIGTSGTNGTASQAEQAAVDERRAVAEIEGGVPSVYSHAFARLQLTPPSGLSVPRWLQAVDDAGRFLDAFGAEAEVTGWSADDLFGLGGLVLSLRGAQVTKLAFRNATLSDGRSFTRGKEERLSTEHASHFGVSRMSANS